MAPKLDNNNIIEGTRERQLTERARSAAQDGIAGFQTNSNSNSRTADPDRIPDRNVDPATAVASQRDNRDELRDRLQGLNLPDRRPSQVGPSGLLGIQFAADHTPAAAARRNQERAHNSPISIAIDSDGGRDPSIDQPRQMSYISLHDAKELFSSMTNELLHLHSSSVDITRGYTPKWDHGKDKFHHFEHHVELYMKRHGISHLLKERPSHKEHNVHSQALMIITAQLTKGDQRIIKDMEYLCTVWSFLVQKYHPSIEADRVKLLRLWETCRKGNRSVKEFHSEVIGLEEQLHAHDYTIPRFLVLDKLHACGPEFEIVRAAVQTTCQTRNMPYFEIMGQYVSYEERRGLHRSFRPDNRKPGQQRSTGAGEGGQGAGNILAAKEKETRSCYHCGEEGHLEADCPKLSAEIRAHVHSQRLRNKPGRGRGRGRGSKRNQ